MRLRPLVAEGLGTASLLYVVVGSGLRAGQSELPAHAVFVGLALAVLIALFMRVSGAHFNPAVTLAIWRGGDLQGHVALNYVAAQISGAVLGVVLAHASFGLPLVSTSTVGRTGGGLLVSEVIGTAMLVLLVLGLTERRLTAWIPISVGAWVAVMTYASSSGGFLNPAVTVSRTLTDSATGIASASVPGFVIAQLAGSVLALVLMSRLLTRSDPKESCVSHPQS